MTNNKNLSKLNHSVTLIIFIAINTFFISPALCAVLDNKFGQNGVVTSAIGSVQDRAQAVLVQPDNNIVAAGTSEINGHDYFAVSRYLTDGGLDSSFNGTGIVTTSISTGENRGMDVALQKDGKIVVVGYSWDDVIIPSSRITVLRIDPNGQLDLGFGIGGKVTTGIENNHFLGSAVAIQTDGKILVTGKNTKSGGYSQFLTVRYNNNGKLDTGFGINGLVETSFSAGNDSAFGIALQQNGAILVVGQMWNGSDFDLSLARYHPNGSLDRSFNNTGTVATDIGGDDVGFGIEVQFDGKILITGTMKPTSPSVGKNFFLLRYSQDGSLDSDFGLNGIVTSPALTTAGSILIQPDSKIIVSGIVYDVSGSSSSLIKFRSDGSIDASFADNGQATFSLGADLAPGIALQTDGKILGVAGYEFANIGMPSLFSIFRFDSQEILDVTPDLFEFSDAIETRILSKNTSNPIIITGLANGVKVPIVVVNGSYSINNSSIFTDEIDFVENGDQVVIQNISANMPKTTVITSVSIGGYSSSDNPSLILGSVTQASFQSVTSEAAITNSSSGGGAISPWLILILYFSNIFFRKCTGICHTISRY